MLQFKKLGCYGKKCKAVIKYKRRASEHLTVDDKAAGCLSDENYFYSNTNALVCSTVKGLKTQLRR